jgi:hypothetical protein
MRAATLARLLDATVTLKTVTGINAYGQPTTSTSTVPARVVRNHVRSVTPQGIDFISTTQVALANPVSVGDRITLDGEDTTVQQVKAASGLQGGVTLYEALL